MSTKAEEQDAGATQASERSAEQGDGPALSESGAAAAQTLPSIIVDPTFSAFGDANAAPAEEPSVKSEGSNGMHVDATPAPAPDVASTPAAPERDVSQAAPIAPPAAELELSSEEADRFAENFRPSWEPVAPVVGVVPVAARVSLPALSPAAVIVPEPELPPVKFVGADLRKRGMLMAGGAVAGFFALVALAFGMTTRSLPSHGHAASKIASAPAPEVTAPSSATEAPSTTTPPSDNTAGALVGLRAAPPAPAAAQETPPAENAAAQAANAAAAPAEPAATVEPPAPAPAVQAPAPSPAPALTRPASTTPVAIATPTAAPASPAAPAPIRVLISATPASAHISFDGAAVSNPFEAQASKGARHRVQVEAAGHASRDVTVAFERDQKLTIKLERTRSAAARHPSAAASRPSASFATTPAHAANSAPVVTVRPSATPPSAAKPSATKGAGFVNESPY